MSSPDRPPWPVWVDIPDEEPDEAERQEILCDRLPPPILILAALELAAVGAKAEVPLSKVLARLNERCPRSDFAQWGPGLVFRALWHWSETGLIEFEIMRGAGASSDAILRARYVGKDPLPEGMLETLRELYRGWRMGERPLYR